MYTAACKKLIVAMAIGAALGPANALRADEADDRFAVAAGHYDRQQWKPAVEEFRAFVQKYPNDRRISKCHFFLGEAQLQLDKLDEARKQFREYVEREPNGEYARAALYRSGEAAYLTGNFSAAKPDLEAFRARYPDDKLNAYVLPYLGDIALSSNQSTAASGYFREGLARFADGQMQDDCRFGLGRALDQQGQTDEAERMYLAVASKSGSPLAEAAQFHLGALQYAAGRYAQSIQTLAAFDDRLATSSWQPNARLGHGLALLKLDRPAEAVKQFDALLATPSVREELLQQALRGKIQAELQLKNSAAAVYQRLASEYPQFPKLDSVLYEWAWTLLEQNKPDDAGKLFERMRKEFPHSRYAADATYRLAQRAFDAKAYDQATGLVDELLDQKAATVSGDDQAARNVRQFALFLRGQIAAARADWPQTRTAFETLLKEFPDCQRQFIAQFWVAESYYRQGDYSAAGSRFNRLAEQITKKGEPWMAMIPLRRAQALAQQKEWADAYAIAAKIAAEFPKFEQQYEVDYLLGRCLASQGDFEGARQAYNRVIQSPGGAKTETAAMAQWMIGETFFHQKDYQAALREYSRLEILYAYPTWQAGALLQAGKCHELLGERKEADQRYRRILKNYPKSTFAEQAAGRLQRLEKATPAK